MMKYYFLIIFLLIIGCTTNQPDLKKVIHKDENKSTEYLDTATNLRFPKKVKKWERINIQKFPQESLGIRIRYLQRGFAHADIFIYDNGHIDIATGVDSFPVQQEFKKIQENYLIQKRNGVLASVEKTLDSTPVIKGPEGVAKLLVAMYTVSPSKSPKREFSSWILLTGYKGKFLKLLYSHNSEEFEKGQAELKELIVELLAVNKNEVKYFFR